MSLLRVVTHNWQVKVVAFFLAVALWLYTSGQARIERTLTVQVREASVRSLPDDCQIVSITPRDFRIDVDGPSTLLNDLPRDVIEPRLEIAADRVNQGQQTFAITTRALGLPADVRIERVQPENIDGITVKFDRIVERYVEVAPLIFNDQPAGVDVAWSIEPNRVRVRGPQAVVAELERQKVPFGAVSLNANTVDPQLTEPVELHLQLTPQFLGRAAVIDNVTANITVTPVVSARQALNVPVGLLVPADFPQHYRVELSQSQVAVTVHGPANWLRELRPSDLTAYVDLLHGFEPDVRTDVKVTVVGQGRWMTFDDVHVSCTTHVIAPRAPTPSPDGEEPR